MGNNLIPKSNFKGNALIKDITTHIKSLATETDEFKKSEFFKNYLETIKKFHRYSYFNQLLIMKQKPNAQRVAGFNVWKSLKRYVKKGEKGIMILAPTFKKIIDKKSEEEKTILSYFMPVYIFDENQTLGEELPKIEIDIIGSDYKKHLDILKDFCDENKIKLDFKKIGVNGLYGFSKGKSITIAEQKSINTQFNTLIHEIAHELIHYKPQNKDLSKQQKEIQAESVAYVVCSYLGLENKSINYLAIYDADYKIIMTNLKVISETSKKILLFIDEKMGVC